MYYLRMSLARPLLVACLALTALAVAQDKPLSEPLSLVLPVGPGRIVLPSDPDLSDKSIAVYDEGQRPVARFSDSRTGITFSYILFHNISGEPTGRVCRDDVLEGLTAKLGGSISNVKKSASLDPSGEFTMSMVESIDGSKIQQQNVFGFFGDAKTCAEIHLSKVAYKLSDESLLNARLLAFQADLSYVPTLEDYFLMASVLFKSAPSTAAPYYQSALAAIPISPGTLRPRRIVTDQLAMSLGIGGKLKESRTVLENAIASDPDYPMNYYNLACADAENGDASNAKIHLQQAFDRKANILNGESFPDPTKDDSFLKLKTNKAFWAYAESLSTPAK